MRNRIDEIVIGGQARKVFKYERFPGHFVSAVYVTSETPQHAELSIRKINSYKWRLLHDGMKPKTPKARRKMFYMLDKTRYRAAIGL